jgi:methylglyoxal synthase
VAPACLAGAVRNATGLRVRAVLPAAQGGTLQIGAEVAAGELDALVFLRDPLAAPPHQSEGVALLRIADLHNVAVATNLAGAECLVRALCAEPALSARG